MDGDWIAFDQAADGPWPDDLPERKAIPLLIWARMKIEWLGPATDTYWTSWKVFKAYADERDNSFRTKYGYVKSTYNEWRLDIDKRGWRMLDLQVTHWRHLPEPPEGAPCNNGELTQVWIDEAHLIPQDAIDAFIASKDPSNKTA